MRPGPFRVLRNQRKAVMRAAQSRGPERFGTGLFRDGMTLYRFFDDAQHADAFVAGRIRLSTLETCRRREAGLPALDAGFVAARPGLVVGGDPAFGFVARDGAPVESAPPEGDAFVLCATERREGDDGAHCVEILLPHLFRLAVQWRLKSRRADFIGSDVGRVAYESAVSALPGFTKTPDRYQSRQEVRFVYRVQQAARLQPFVLRVPEIAGLCRRLS